MSLGVKWNTVLLMLWGSVGDVSNGGRSHGDL